jgi:hypothetical protein
MRDDESRYVREDRRAIATEGDAFDRLAFAMRALRILRPRGLSVVVCEGTWDLRVERGRDWARGAAAEWALVAIPPDATRAAIALALADLTGLGRDPFVIDVLIGAAAPN